MVTSTIRRGHAEKAENRRRADVGSLLGIARIDARAFDAEKDEHRDQHRRPDLFEQARLGMPSPPQKFARNRSALNAKNKIRMKTRIGTILATVTTVLMEAACCTPRRIMKWNSQMPIEATRIAAIVLPSPKTGKERSERRFDQHPIGNIADATADPVAEGRQKARIIAEAGFRISKDAGIEVRLALSQRLEHASQHVHAARRNAPGDDRAERTGRAVRKCGAGKRCRRPPSSRRPFRSAPTGTASVQRSAMHDRFWNSGCLASLRQRMNDDRTDRSL